MSPTATPADTRTDRITWSTTPIFWCIIAVLVLVPAVAAIAVLFFSTASQSAGPLVLLATLNAVILSLAPNNLGTYGIDDDGISFRPAVGKHRHILWRDVDRILWLSHATRVRSGRRSIFLKWDLIPARARLAATQIATDALAPHFDLSLPPPTTALTPRGILRILLAVVALGGLFVLPPYYVLLQNPNAGLLWHMLLLAPLPLLYALIVPLAIRQHRRRYPHLIGWRHRRSSPI